MNKMPGDKGDSYAGAMVKGPLYIWVMREASWRG